MISLTTISDTPSELIQKRAESMRAEKYDSGAHTISFRVGVRGRRFEDFVLFDAKRGVAICSRLKDGSLCEVNQNGRLCAHVWTAALQMDAENNRRAA